MMGEGNKVASVIMFTFTQLGMPSPYVHTAFGMHSYLRVVIALLLCSLAVTACIASCLCS